jgi:hypothetical protein
MDLPDSDEDDKIDDEEISQYTPDQMNALMADADKIDRALPQVDMANVDEDYDKYADKAIDAFDDLMDLGKSVEDRHAAEIFQAASSMLGNALNAKTNKAQKKLETVKLQLNKAKLEHEKEKLEYLKARHLGNKDDTEEVETEGRVIASRTELLREILSHQENNEK